ncbi:MAG: hypothetical protein EOP88_21065 [Verrucomicrobiaceae bacterium]|nr:MAG: hypothetical protein EOP88_21065 [Verrucomicrobiaceae bacterium]
MIHRTWMLAGLAAFPILTGCGDKEGAETGPTVKFDSPWTCEEHWMASNIAADLRGMAKLAGATVESAETVPGKKEREYRVGKVTLVMSPSCWDTASYKPLLEGWKPKAVTAPASADDLLGSLLTPNAAVLQKANGSVSKRIKESPADAAAHEDAAFLLGVFGIRDNARAFSDVRSVICRMTAHLALAEHLRGGGKASPNGEWAKVLFELHVGRTRGARELAAAIPQEGNSGRWKRVVDLLATGDWRRMGDLADPSLAEMIAHARALKIHRGNPQMMEFVTQHKAVQEVPEWSRLLPGNGRSVEEGHLLMRSGLPMEMLEIGQVFKIGKDPKPADLTKVLAVTGPVALVAKEGEPRVIQDSDWAAYFRRHFFATCSDVSRFALRSWGSDEAAEEWEAYVLPYCRPLPGHELVEPLVSTQEADFRKDMQAAAKFTLGHPEQVPMALWFDYRYPNLEVTSGGEMPAQKPWFREPSPPGTAYDACLRIRFDGMMGGPWVPTVTALHKIDPWDSELCFEVAESGGSNPASVEKGWGEMREYSTQPLRQLLKNANITPDERIGTLRTLAPLDQEYGLQLGYLLAMTGKPEEAIKAYEAAYEEATDRVAVSNQTQWMIHYYKSTGQDAKAREIADHNEEVYSQSGLVSAFTLAVVEKDVARAKKLARAIEERYGEGRYVPVAAWQEGKNEKLLRQIFPEGIKQVTVADFKAEEKYKGTRIAENSLTVRTAGLRAGDVVLAVNGQRVESFRQYFMLMASELEPRVRILYRRGKTFAEVECLLPERRLDSSMPDYGD